MVTATIAATVQAPVLKAVLAAPRAWSAPIPIVVVHRSVSIVVCTRSICRTPVTRFLLFSSLLLLLFLISEYSIGMCHGFGIPADIVDIVQIHPADLCPVAVVSFVALRWWEDSFEGAFVAPWPSSYT
jgi:hypothetical protein